MGLLRSSLAAFRDVQVALLSIFCDMLSLLGEGGGRGAFASRPPSGGCSSICDLLVD